MPRNIPYSFPDSKAEVESRLSAALQTLTLPPTIDPRHLAETIWLIIQLGRTKVAKSRPPIRELVTKERAPLRERARRFKSDLQRLILPIIESPEYSGTLVKEELETTIRFTTKLYEFLSPPDSRREATAMHKKWAPTRNSHSVDLIRDLSILDIYYEIFKPVPAGIVHPQSDTKSAFAARRTLEAIATPAPLTQEQILTICRHLSTPSAPLHKPGGSPIRKEPMDSFDLRRLQKERRTAISTLKRSLGAHPSPK